MASFEIISDIVDIEVIAIGKAIRDLPRLKKLYGEGRWRKMKGTATIRLSNGSLRKAEIHWCKLPRCKRTGHCPCSA
jgi:hypothetical protein